MRDPLSKRWKGIVGALLVFGIGIFLWKYAAQEESSDRGARNEPRRLELSSTGTAASGGAVGSGVSEESAGVFRFSDLIAEARQKALSPKALPPEGKSQPELPTVFPDVPSLEEYRADAARDPHATSSLLKRFAIQVSPWMENALKPDGAPEFRQDAFRRLAQCSVLDLRRFPPAAVSFCWGNARRLLKSFPEDERLRRLYTEAETQVSEATRKTVETLERI